MQPARFTEGPLGIATLVAISVHFVILLGISFDLSPTNLPTPKQAIDINLVVPAPPPKLQEQADFPAPSAQTSNPLDSLETANKQQAKPKPEVSNIKKPAKKQHQQVIAQKKPQKPQAIKSAETVKTKPESNLTQLLASARQEIDLLTSAIDTRPQAASNPLKRKMINASTQDYKYAAYLDAWRKKIERVGHLNYPGEARRKNLYGSLRLQVAVRADGSLEAVRLLRSSGHTILDEAAKKIVRLAAPFAPFPTNVRQEVDVLDITRSWQFRSSGGLFSSN